MRDSVRLGHITRVVGARDALACFVQAMEIRLRENDHKHGWSHLTYAHLIRRIRDELGEVERAIQRRCSPAELIAEAADVANFAMMIADNALKCALAHVEADLSR